MAGDAAWSDYTVAADVRFLSESPAVVMGRIASADVFQDGEARWPSGYILSVAPDGSWQLLSTNFKQKPNVLGRGTIQLDRNQWHHLQLAFHGSRIEGFCEGKSLISVTDSSHTHGMFGLGTEWGHTQFDNLSVSPSE